MPYGTPPGEGPFSTFPRCGVREDSRGGEESRIKALLSERYVLFCALKENQKSARYFRSAGGTGRGLLAPNTPNEVGPVTKTLEIPAFGVKISDVFFGRADLRLRRRFQAAITGSEISPQTRTARFSG